MKISKKLLSLVLAVLMIATIFVPSVSAAVSSATYSSLPVIYIKGNASTAVYDSEGNKIWPLSSSVISSAIEADKNNIISKALTSYTTGNWNYLASELEKAFAPYFSKLMLDSNGNPQYGTHIDPKCNEPVKDTDGKYDLEQYCFNYDPRLDPLEIAVSLRTYVNKVLKATGKAKVNMVARCMGTTMLSAYLTKYKSDTKCNTVIYYSSAAQGVLIEESPFSGELIFNTKTLKALAGSTDSELISSILNGLIRFFGSDTVTKAVGNIMSEAIPGVLPRVLRATYGTYPSYWSLIDDNYYNKCLNFVYGTSSLRNQYAGLIKKFDNYHNTVYSNLLSTLSYLKKSKGVNINVIAKYNLQFDSIYEGCEAQGDSWIESSEQAFGATFADYGSRLTINYCETMAKSGLGNYISSDRVIDTSTCLFPDYTWFVKNINHTVWPKAINDLMYAIFSRTTQVTVKTFSNFPQFVKFSDGKLVNIYNYDQTKKPEVETAKLTKTDYVYNGNNVTPSVVIKATDDSTLKKGTDYTVTYEEPRSAIGKHWVKIRYIGNYSGTTSKKLYFYVRPADVSGIKITTNSSTSATITWNKALGAQKYKVYKYNTSTKSWNGLGTTSNLTFTVKNLTAGSNVKLAVRAIHNNGVADYYSLNFCCSTAYLTPSNPVGVKATAGTRQITLNWTKTNGATSYQIFRSTSQNGVYKRVATVTTNSYINTGLFSSRTYYYKVKAVKTANGTNYNSGFSAIVSAKTK